jgi:hypothetical protein
MDIPMHEHVDLRIATAFRPRLSGKKNAYMKLEVVYRDLPARALYSV